MGAIFKREFKSFFTSPVGYFVLAVIFVFSGWFFFVYNLASGYTDLSYVYSNLFTIVILIVLPILTMRLFSDDKRQRTDQALLTAPVNLTAIVVGKFLAAMIVFVIGLSITLLFAVIIAVQVTPDWLVIIGNFLGMLLLGGMVISIGLLISSLTESQFIAALGTFVVSFALMMVDQLSSLFSSNALVVKIVEFSSIFSRYNDFTVGIINYDNIIFFLSMQVLFIFLTVRVLDRKRWS